MKIREKLPLALRNQLWITDDAEKAILGHCAKKANVPQNLFTAYSAGRQAEREIVKTEASEGDNEKAIEIIDVYRAVRKEAPWNFMKLRQKFRTCFQKSSSGLKEYLAIRKQETAKDVEISKNGQDVATQPVTEPGEGPLANLPRDDIYDIDQNLKGEAAGRISGERKARSEDMETVGTGKDGGGGGRDSAVKYVIGTVDESKGAAEINGDPDVANTRTTANTDVGDDSFLLKFAMVFGMVVHLVIAVLILVSQGDRMAEWCRGRKSEEDIYSRRETEPLHTGKQIPATGTTFTMSNTGFNPA